MEKVRFFVDVCWWLDMGMMIPWLLLSVFILFINKLGMEKPMRQEQIKKLKKKREKKYKFCLRIDCSLQVLTCILKKWFCTLNRSYGSRVCFDA